MVRRPARTVAAICAAPGAIVTRTWDGRLPPRAVAPAGPLAPGLHQLAHWKATEALRPGSSTSVAPKRRPGNIVAVRIGRSLRTSCGEPPASVIAGRPFSRQGVRAWLGT